MLESIQNNEFEYEKISPEDQQKRGILGRLKGIISDFKNPTRNGRLYGQKVWESVFNDPITQEKIANRCMFGEIEHPLDGRTAIDPEKIAVCLAEVPKKDNKGHLIGVFDILNTPCGKILKTLLDYGTTVGISSRGTGDTFINSDGIEEVDPGSYDCTGWDVVLIPAVKEARLSPITESVGGKSLKQALNESIESSTEDDKKVMLEELDKIGIQLKEDSEETDDSQSKEAVDINAEIENEEADNDGEALVEELQNALSQVQELQEKVGNLQEKLSVCYAKEYDYEDEIERHKKTISKLTESQKSIDPLRKRVNTLTEELDKKNTLVSDSQKTIEESKQKVKNLSNKFASLKEELNQKDQLIESLNKQLEEKENKLSSNSSSLKNKIDSLQEQLINTKKEYSIKAKGYSDKLEKANKLVEQYKKIAKTSVDKYIESQAIKLGITSKDIKSRLNESYSFKDIDDVCDEIQESKFGMSNLPFKVGFNKNSRIRITESVDKNRFPVNEDDRVDDDLLELAGIK